jgi:hypothetical protein
LWSTSRALTSSIAERCSLTGGATPHLQFERHDRMAPTCARCGDVIGVYEATVILLDGETRMTSRAAERDVVAKAAERYHRGCYPDR